MRRPMRIIGGVFALVAAYKLGQCSTCRHERPCWMDEKHFKNFKNSIEENTTQLDIKTKLAAVDPSKSSELLEC